MEEYRELLGQLIGLARATDGSEHLITESAVGVVKDVLRAEEGDTALIQQLLARVGTEKRSLVPDCFHCANPCGRTSAYDLTDMTREEEAVQAEKKRILKALRNLAASEPVGSEVLLFHGLIFVGMEGCSASELSELAARIEESAKAAG